MVRVIVAALVLELCAGGAEARQRFNWDTLGAEFCRLTLANDLPGLRDLLSPALQREIMAAAAAGPKLPPARVLFQTYANPVPVCTARTRNAALVEITRSMPGGALPAWTEYLVMVPVSDGSTRIDDVLFATRKSDTLRARLEAFTRR